MEEHTDGSGPDFCRTAHWCCAVFALVLSLHTADADAIGPRRHFDLEAGDATVMLNEFSRQSDLQVLFDFNILKGMRTHPVNGELDASDALTSMLAGTNLIFDFVNERTLAVTPSRKKPSLLHRLWQRLKSRSHHDAPQDGLEQVLISGTAESGTAPLLGAQTIQFTRPDIDRSGLATVQDFLRTLPEVFGGGPSEYTTLGREASTNSARGTGVNIRGLDAGATLVLIDGRRVAPSGTQGIFNDVSNIPLSIIEHIDVLPDGASARYGADAVGGVVNFVTRSNFSGVQTQARAGGVTNGSMGERQVSQLFGSNGDSGNGLLSFEYFQRDALRAQDRWQYTSDLTPFGGSNFDSMYGSPGTITDGTYYWPIPKGQHGTSLTASSLLQGPANLYDQYQGTDITPEQARWSLFGKGNMKLTDDVTVFGEGLFTRRNVQSIQAASYPLTLSVPESNPFYVNPTGIPGPVTVYTGSSAYFGPPADNRRIDTGNFTLGVATPAPGGWTASGYVGYTFEKQHEVQQGVVNQAALATALADPNPATAFNPFGDGANTNPATLAAVSGSGLYDLASSLEVVSLTATGPALSLQGGDIQATVGTEYRIQKLDSTTTLPDASENSRSGFERKIAAAFAELRIPLIGEGSDLSFARRLELSLGARREDYTDIGNVTIPKVGLHWWPSKDFGVRSTWTKSFRPPNLTDLVKSGSYSIPEQINDPSSPTGLTTVLVRYGTNPDLSPERARSWTLGTDFTPQSLPGLSASLTYFDVDYIGRIANAQLSPDALTQPQYAWLVNRNVTAAALNDACSHSVFQGAPGTCLDPTIGAILDNRVRNIAQLRTRGVDFIGRYALDSSVGKFDLGLNGTYLFQYSQANTPGSPLVNIVSTQNNPINLRLRGSVSWARRGLATSTYVNYANSYRDTLSIPTRGVPSWTTIDLQLSYETSGDTLGWLGHVQFALNAQNVFDVHPPFLNNNLVGLGYDQENANLYGRIVSFDVRKRW